MMNAVTWQLLAVLLAAALLGILIGLSAMRLHQAQREKEAYNSHEGAIGKLTAERDDLNSEKASIMQALESEKKLSGIVRDKHAHIVAQQDALKVHAELQAKRLTKQGAELHASEEKCIRLERDFASFKVNKLREVRMLKVNPEEWLDNEELPVLSKKVNQNCADSASSDRSAPTIKNNLEEPEPDLNLTQPIIASELDIPSLAESELPDSVGELEFELADIDETY